MKNLGKVALNTTTILIILAVAVVAYLVYDSQHTEPYTVSGTYAFVGNPGFTSPIPPGMVYAIDTGNMGVVYLTNESLGGYGDLLWTNEPNIPIGARVGVMGELWYRDDVSGITITLLEYTSIEEI